MPDTLLPLILFAVAGAFTPGPNNLMSAASGAAFGLRRTLPQIGGVTFGFAVMLVALSLGLAAIFTRYPLLHSALRILGSLYLLYLAWRIANAGELSLSGETGKPPTFMEAALFQWVNPKAWTLALGALAAFTSVGGAFIVELAAILIVFAVMTVGSLVTWCLFGQAVARFLTSPKAARAFNLTMAGLVALSVVMLFL
jgi:threonine/homoserine/homoserine lactone efflux protein